MHSSSIRKKKNVPQTFIQHGIVTLVQKKRSVPQVMPEPANMGESNDPCEKERYAPLRTEKQRERRRQRPRKQQACQASRHAQHKLWEPHCLSDI